jgi:hypothetical protein
MIYGNIEFEVFSSMFMAVDVVSGNYFYRILLINCIEYIWGAIIRSWSIGTTIMILAFTSCIE